MGDTRSVDDDVRAFLARHVSTFNAAVASGDFEPLVALFAEDASLEFVGVPAGPFVGRDAIAAAYGSQPPDDALEVVSVDEEPGGVVLERFVWHRGGTGTMRVTLADGRIARLVVAFD